MSDFVAEVRRRSYSPRNVIPTYSPGEFVAEIRPRTINHSNMNIRQDLLNISDQDVQTILSDRHFSRESITRLLEDSILMLVKKILNSQKILRTEGSLSISLNSHEAPIVINLSHIFSSFQGSNKCDTPDPSLEGAFNVKIKNGEVSMQSCPMDEESFVENPFHEFERDPCDALAEMDNKSLSPPEYYRDEEAYLSSPPHNFYCCLPSPPRDQLKAASCVQTLSSASDSKLERHRRHESDEESGYTSNDKDDSDAACEHTVDAIKPHAEKQFSTFNDYYCNGFDGKNTLYTSYERRPAISSPHTKNQNAVLSRDSCYEMDYDEEEEDAEYEHRLVIDESTAQDEVNTTLTPRNKNYSQSMDLDVDSRTRVFTLSRNVPQCVLQSKKRTRDCQSDETEDLDSPVSSDITDTDAPVDLSGDSKFSSDVVSAVPHPQSLVFKHPEGFMCKQCSHILPDAEAVSNHVQSKHDLHCCTFCCRTFTAKNNLKRHIRIHTGHRPYKCTQCSQSFARRDDLKGHTLRHDYSKPFRCSLCKKGYTDRACVKNHMAKEHRSRLMHVCPQCGESYDQEEAFAAHKKSHPELQQYSCDTCSFIGTNNLMTQKHALLHSHKLFSCKPCNAYFADPFDYTNHVRKHKKLVAFSQYICCFCDLALATYDQYIRHEYSHAQSKTHTCKTCKKQFKSKSLLQDHALLHQEPELGKAGTDVEMYLEVSTIKEPKTISGQSKEVKTSIYYNDSMESTFTDDYTNRSSESPSPPGINITFQSIPEEEDCDEFQGQLLDLSMKKPSSSKVLGDDHINLRSCPRVTGLTDENFPRNGVVQSESCILSQEHEVSKRAFRAHQSQETDVQKQMNCKTVFRMQESVNIKSRMNKDWDYGSSDDAEVSLSSPGGINNRAQSYLQVSELYPTRPRSVERIRVITDEQYAKPEHRPLQRTVSQDYNLTTPLRFSPYSRKKMADLAAKFVAARGTKLFEQRIPRKSVVHTTENRKQVIILNEDTDQQKMTSILTSSRWQLASNQKDRSGLEHNSLNLGKLSPKQKSILSCQAGHGSDGISRVEPNPEMALKYHVPILVKSEPALEKDLDEEAAYRCRFKNIIGDNLGNTISAVNMINSHSASSYECEDCKVEFGSFSELENHSVDQHKRYLCEHCKKSFTARPNRDRHVRYHTGERPYKCDLCDMAFFRGDDLKYHRTTRHPTAMPFICTRCSASFTWSRDLERHIRHSKCKL